MPNIYFGGGAIWGMYEYIGCLRYIQKNNIQIDNVYGISAGSGIGLVLLLEIQSDDFELFMNDIINVSKTSDSLTKNHLKGIEFCFRGQSDDIYKKLNNKFHIGICDANGFGWKSQFSNNKDIANTMICSGSIPFFSTYNCNIDGCKTYDGGIDKNGLIIPDNTLIYRPFTHFPMNIIIPNLFIRSLLIMYGEYYMDILLATSPTISSTIAPLNINTFILRKLLFLIANILPVEYTDKDISLK
jgi:hypothetical protein